MTAGIDAAAVFASAFLAATLLPLSSEGVLLGALALAPERAVSLVLLATLGNTLGACVNWAVGRGLLRLSERSRLRPDPARLARAQAWFRRFGPPCLLLAWLPVVGDALTVVAGMLRMPLWLFVPPVALGKGLRYAALAGLFGLAAG